MRVVIQRVNEASVTIDGKLKSDIGQGLLILVGVEDTDEQQDADWLTSKIAGLRIFDDENGIMNRSVTDVDGEILVVSQFTLHAMMGLIVALDAFSSIIFAHLRYKNRPIKFAVLKFLYVVLNIFFNLFFLMVCPWLMQKAPSLVSWFYVPGYGVGYVFISNLLATVIQTLILSKHLFEAEFKLDLKLLNSILKYSFPLLILGIAGIANQNLDKILFPYLREGNLGKSELGIYGVTSKMSMVMMMFTQAFRFAYEPFVFAQHKEKNSLKVYADAMMLSL